MGNFLAAQAKAKNMKLDMPKMIKKKTNNELPKGAQTNRVVSSTSKNLYRSTSSNDFH